MRRNWFFMMMLTFVAFIGVGAYAYLGFHHPVRQSGADTPTPKSIQSTVALGQATTGLPLSITPLSVEQDSRCPVDVECIQAGTVKVRLSVEGLGLTLELGKPIRVGSSTIELWGVNPVKNSKIPIKDSDYRFTFQFQ